MLHRVPGLRSLRGRLLLAMIAIAVVAVSATAWLTSRDTADRLRSDVEQNLEVDGRIYSELLSYAQSNRDWGDVDSLVRDLEAETGRRIALTTPLGDSIADSARLDGGGGAPLPEQPAALIDPFNTMFPLFGGLVAWTEVEMGSDTDGSDVLDSSSFSLEDPTAALDEELVRCLGRRGVPYTTLPELEGSGLSTIEVDADDTRAIEAFDACYTAAEDAVDRRWSDPALLYLGTRDRTGLTALRADGRRTLLAAGAVTLLAVAVTVAVSRRLLRPVAALTVAARRMEGGDLAQRVEVQGDDELAGLARSFNAMAEALATNETQRRRLVNDVAHELRTPLANVRGYLEAALDGVAPADDQLLASLHEEALLLQRLVDDLQTLALAEAHRLVLHRESVDLAALADQVAVAHSHQADTTGVGLVVERQGDEPTVVHADPGRVRQALGNLVSNALRHSTAGDQVNVRVRADATEAIAEVADTGVGIAPEELPHVFDRFWRADTSRTRDTGGSGLGLAICSHLVEAHGGTVGVTSTLGEGSVFTIRLPRQS